MLQAQKQRSYLSVLSDLNLMVFPLVKVEAYLNAKYGRPRFSWHYGRKATWGWRRCSTLSGSYDFGYSNPKRNGELLSHPYERPIPYPVLQTIQGIQMHCGNRRSVAIPVFIVSDVTNEADFYRDPDPFLACLWSTDIVVIERWDEPSFRME
jgi:hypothetical protein